MGGKNYFCDFCQCFMKNDINVRRKHNAGLSHTIAKVTYMRRFEDPRKVLVEERSKLPCKRYLSGSCKFGLFCQFSHYNENHLSQLQKAVNNIKRHHRKHSKKIKKGTPSQWECSGRFFPPSLQPVDFNKLKQHVEVSWG